VPAAYADALGTRTFRPHPKGGLGQVIRTKQVAHIVDLRTNPGYLVARFSQIEGYKCLSLTRALDVVKCQLALA
jgi:hypothetical protein